MLFPAPGFHVNTSRCLLSEGTSMLFKLEQLLRMRVSRVAAPSATLCPYMPLCLQCTLPPCRRQPCERHAPLRMDAPPPQPPPPSLCILHSFPVPCPAPQSLSGPPRTLPHASAGDFIGWQPVAARLAAPRGRGLGPAPRARIPGPSPRDRAGPHCNPGHPDSTLGRDSDQSESIRVCQA